MRKQSTAAPKPTASLRLANDQLVSIKRESHGWVVTGPLALQGVFEPKSKRELVADLDAWAATNAPVWAK